MEELFISLFCVTLIRYPGASNISFGHFMYIFKVKYRIELLLNIHVMFVFLFVVHCVENWELFVDTVLLVFSHHHETLIN